MKPSSPLLHWAALIALLLAALFLRVYRLDEVPPGLTHDEADTGYFAAAVYGGARSQVEAPYGYAYQPFTMYSGALFMHLFGPTGLALRYHSAFWGMVVLLFTYLWGRRAFGRAAGLGGAALVALSFWTVADSRFALNSEPAPALVTAAAYCLWLALDRPQGRQRWWAWLLFALLLAGSTYAYEAALAAAAAFALFFVYLALFDWARFRRCGLWFGGALVLAALLAAPHLLDPAAWGRTQTLSGPLQALLGGDVRPLLHNALGALGTISFSGDSFVTYNLPGRPILDPLVSVFFYGGVLLCLWRWRRPACAFVLLWAALGLVPSLVLGEWTSTLHSKAAQSPILLLPAVSAVEVWQWVSARLGRRWGAVLAALGAAWLVVVGVSTGYDYFVRWGRSPDTRAAYFHNLAEASDFVQEGTYSGVVVLSAPFPELPLDPLIGAMRVQRDDVTLRWCDARRALLFPDAAEVLLILPTNAPLDPWFAPYLPLGAAERVVVDPQGIDPYFDVLRWAPSQAWGTIESHLQRQAVEPPSLPADFGGAAMLVGYELETPVVRPGETLELITAWQVEEPAALGAEDPRRYGREAAIFVHLLDAQGNLVAQEDRLDVPAWGWQRGDRFLQIHRLTTGAELPAGAYRLAVGLYTRPDLVRLPLLAAGAPVSDQVLLSWVEVMAP